MFPRHYALAALLVLLAACGWRKGPPSIGVAYVGPATLSIRQELAPKSAVVAEAKHGEELEVIQTRRRFVRVRTAGGLMGWTDSRMLLSTAQMRELRKLADLAANFSSQGDATVLEAVNMHTEPNRWSPSFIQIPENGLVQVISHRAIPKVAAPPVSAPVPSPPVLPAPSRKSKGRKVPAPKVQPPMPKPPALPPNWLELSRNAIPDPGAEEEFAKETAAEAAKANKVKEESEPEKPVTVEDWSLVRTKEGKAGWVLTRMLYLPIPDEVAKYAEGHRITSYFPVADVKDGDVTKRYWLWTTIRHGGQEFEYDTVRLFVWSVKRHRYETAFSERGLRGYFPVEIQRGSGERGAGSSFSTVIEDGGRVFRKVYSFNGYRVNVVRIEPFDMSTEEYLGQIQKFIQPKPNAAEAEDSGFFSTLKKRAKSLVGGK